jgi:hypothetical protein
LIKTVQLLEKVFGLLASSELTPDLLWMQGPRGKGCQIQEVERVALGYAKGVTPELQKETAATAAAEHDEF